MRTPRALLLALSLILVGAAAELPSSVDAQVRASRPSGTRAPGARRSSSDNRRTTSGRTRARGGGASRRSGRRSRRRGFGGYVSSRDARGCSDGCGQGWDGDERFGLGVSLGLVGGLFDGDLLGLRGPRSVDGDLRVGLIPDGGLDFRLWGTFGRARFGGMMQGGWAAMPHARSLNEGAFEEGSRLTDGWFLGFWFFGAYQPQLSDVVQLWLGGRLGLHVLDLDVTVRGRRYDSVDRYDLSAGPELGLRLSAGRVGLLLLGFADVTQPGHGQITLSLVFESRKPPGAQL